MCVREREGERERRGGGVERERGRKTERNTDVSEKQQLAAYHTSPD